jgi:cell division protease FtsH
MGTVLPVGGGMSGIVSGRLGDERPGDVATIRRRRRHRRATLTVVTVVAVATYLWWVVSTGRPLVPIPPINWLVVAPLLFFVALGATMILTQVGTGRSPHVTYLPEQIDVRLDDVVGIDTVKDEVVRSLDLFLNHRRFAEQMGGRPRRAVLFEGGPGTGKTHTAKALAAEAGVPFLYASATGFQSSFYGATSRKVRSYFKALRRAARREGGAIGFIDEFDAIAMRRGAAAMSPTPIASAMTITGCGGLEGLPSQFATVATAGPVVHGYSGAQESSAVVNELLVQLQSFELPSPARKLAGKLVGLANLVLPERLQLAAPRTIPANIMLIASTNRADSLDPALMRPGRFDRRLTFETPGRVGRRALIDHFLASRAHAPELDVDEQRDAIAAVTGGYSPAMLEGLFDEALVNAVRHGSPVARRVDVEDARLTLELGLANPTAYTAYERALVATHEAGHTVTAFLAAPERRLEILSIVKRRNSLGLLAHGDVDDVYTRSRAELTALVQIALGGQVAEELFFGDVSTGPGGDLLYATNVTAEMVGSSGMTGSLVSYAAVVTGPLTDTNMVGRVLADPAGRARVDEFLAEQRLAVVALLTDNMDLVVALRDALLERSELIGSEITGVIEAAISARSGPSLELAPERIIDLTDPVSDRLRGDAGR